MIDLSDGLGGDARHLAAASGVALEIDLGSVPWLPKSKDEAEASGVPAQQFAAEGGEDYELLVALPARFDAADSFAQECGIPLTAIGTVGKGSGVRFQLGGRTLELHGFDHFGWGGGPGVWGWGGGGVRGGVGQGLVSPCPLAPFPG